MTLETWPTATKSTFELRQIDFFSTVVDSSWWANHSIYPPFFGRKIPSWEQFESLEGLTTSVLRYRLKPKIGQYQLWDI